MWNLCKITNLKDIDLKFWGSVFDGNIDNFRQLSYLEVLFCELFISEKLRDNHLSNQNQFLSLSYVDTCLHMKGKCFKVKLVTLTNLRWVLYFSISNENEISTERMQNFFQHPSILGAIFFYFFRTTFQVAPPPLWTVLHLLWGSETTNEPWPNTCEWDSERSWVV